MPRPLSATVTELSGWIVDLDVVAVAGERLVDGVVDDLVDQVVQAAHAGRADVHAGPLADGLEALEDRDVLGVVLHYFPAYEENAQLAAKGNAPQFPERLLGRLRGRDLPQVSLGSSFAGGQRAPAGSGDLRRGRPL